MNTSPEREAAARSAEASPETLVDPEAGIAELATTWVSAAGSRVKNTAELALAEARLAAMSFAVMLLLAIVAAVFLLGAWGMLMAGVVTGLNALGLPLWITLLALGAIHLLCAWLLIRLAMKLSVHLELPATRRQLGGTAEPEEDDDIA